VIVGLYLSHSGDSTIPQPIAWSLWPAKIVTRTTVTDRIGFTAKLVMVSYQESQTSETSVEEPFLLARGKRESDPEWRFTGTRQRPLVGMQALSAVIQAPKDLQVSANFMVAATIRGPLGLVRYRGDLKHEYSHLVL